MEQAWFDELFELLRIPSVSADPAHAKDVRAAGEWVRDFLQAAGGTAELRETAAQPLVVGELPASSGQASAPTVLLYGHFDVQPPEPLEEWQSPPFEPAIRGDWLYGRGVADDKGQLYLLLKAAQLLAAEGSLPVNIRVACDGEEEIGGHSIVDFLRADERGAAACVIFDSGMTRPGQPEFAIGVRGLIYFHLRIETGERDLHSGIYGGAALNALHALVETLAPLLPREGRLPEPLRAGIIPPSAEESAGWSELPQGAELLEEAGARPVDVRAAPDYWLRTTAEPALDLNGLAGGSATLQKTVLPVVGEANFSIRLAPGQEVEGITQAVEAELREAAPAGATLELTRLSSSPAGLIPPDSPAVQLALGAFERVCGRRPLLVRSGGTLPIIPALAERGIPTIVTGFALSESNIHSPNERLRVEDVPLGIRAAQELYRSFAELR